VVQHEQRSAEVPVSLFGEWRLTPWINSTETARIEYSIRANVFCGASVRVASSPGLNLALSTAHAHHAPDHEQDYQHDDDKGR
jgi:hypothetical protein